ncbi:hypothetical protein B0H19DRAFT_544593 [Mycena capillaripes]|nr:hypothetical protein B0H19DRAFT_544593 [Mycena capillaripes]
MALRDSKDTGSPALPTPVQMSGPPAYSTIPASSAVLADWSAHPQNHIHISRIFGDLRRTRFTVDPNLHVPSSLLTAPEWEPSESYSFSLRARPKPNLELAVTLGGIDADIHVLPFTGRPRLCPDGQCITESRLLYSRRSNSCQCPRYTALHANATTGNVTLHVEAPPAAHFSVHASSIFGQICVFLPRNFHGPLTIMSSLGAPNLSAELRRACAPISETGSARRWFVGDLAAWRDCGEHGDEAMVGTRFGGVWVGYVGEEEEAKCALQWGALHLVVNVVLAFLLVIGLHWLFKVLCWVLALVGII